MKTIKEQLSRIIPENNIITDADMSGYTSFKAGGKAALLVEPQNTEELQAVIKELNYSDAEYMVLGNGTNVLVRDEGYNGVIVKIGKAFNYVKRQGNDLVCGAGALLSVIAKVAAADSLSGFEFASGIPGSMGGAVFMNAGAYGGEIKNILKQATVITRDGSEVKEMTAEDLEMSYRHTKLHETGDIVVEAVIGLEEGDEDEIRAQMSELAAKRNAKQPVQYPSAGSFFKRPVGYFAGKLIEDAGCKGLCVGGAEVSTLHSGFIINKGGATATDSLSLMDIVRASVSEQVGDVLEPDVRRLGGDGTEKDSEFLSDAAVKG
ncbi:MAG: UDP-N-acetylmuramate dehydrogenase, partial [Mogibacterium sp.]|nr:UDP-N-acetylmuramate dehydrogenase [Mogibacterium sp.]